jgi:hypothetical protein
MADLREFDLESSVSRLDIIVEMLTNTKKRA